MGAPSSDNAQSMEIETGGQKDSSSGSVRKVLSARMLFIWITQMVASLSWFIACLIYNSYDHGDIWQFIASLSWTCSNLASFVDIWVEEDPMPRAKGRYTHLHHDFMFFLAVF